MRALQAAGGTRVDQGAVRQLDFERPEDALVDRDLGVQETAHRVQHPGQRLRAGGVDRAARLCVAAAEVGADRVAADLQFDPHPVVLALIDSVVVDQEFAALRAGRQLGDLLPGAQLGVVHQLGAEFSQASDAVALHQPADPSGSDVDAGQHRADVPEDLFGCAAVGGDDVQHVPLRLAGELDRHGRQDQALVVHLGGVRRQASRGDPADVGHVQQRGGEERHAAVEAHRAEKHHVVGVDAASVGVVEGEHVALAHLVGREVAQKFGQRGSQARQVHQRGADRLRHQPAPAVEDRAGGVSALLDDGRKSAAHHTQAHFLGRGGERVLHDRKRDRIAEQARLRRATLHRTTPLRSGDPPRARPAGVRLREAVQPAVMPLSSVHTAPWTLLASSEAM